MISYDNVKIVVIDTREGEYSHKKKKYIKFKAPKITKKTVFDDNFVETHYKNFDDSWGNNLMLDEDYEIIDYEEVKK